MIDKAWFKSRLRQVKATQDDLAAEANITRSAVNKILGGKNRMNGIYADPFARVLKISPEEVLRRAGILPMAGDAPADTGLAEAHQPARTQDTSDDQRMFLLADTLAAITGIASLPPMPRGKMAMLVKSEVEALISDGTSDEDRARLLNHAINFLHLYLRAQAEE